ncbi:MAG: hypothetical protein AAB655_00145, partial [Patescibacteria group bacterium]
MESAPWVNLPVFPSKSGGSAALRAEVSHLCVDCGDISWFFSSRRLRFFSHEEEVPNPSRRSPEREWSDIPNAGIPNSGNPLRVRGLSPSGDSTADREVCSIPASSQATLSSGDSS